MTLEAWQTCCIKNIVAEARRRKQKVINRELFEVILADRIEQIFGMTAAFDIEEGMPVYLGCIKEAYD